MNKIQPVIQSNPQIPKPIEMCGFIQNLIR